MAARRKKPENGAPKPSEPEGITAITVKGFKSLVDETRVEIRPLTVLCGANSSGKSSIMQPLLLLKQTLEAPFDPGPLLLNGPNVAFTRADEFLSKQVEKAIRRFSVGLEIASRRTLTIEFRRERGQRIDIGRMVWQKGDAKVVLQVGMRSGAIVSQFSALKGDVPELWNDLDTEGDYAIIADRCFLTLQQNLGNTDSSIGSPSYLTMNWDADRLFGFKNGRFGLHASRILHVPGLRGNPQRTYPLSGIPERFPGTFENYAATLIHTWQERSDKRAGTLIVHATSLGLTSHVDAHRLDDTQIEIRVGRLPASAHSEERDLVNIADVGFGVSQVLPVLVALLAAESGQLVYVEQPEIHLHPRAQVALAGIIAEAANRGVRVVIETHSELLLLAIQTEIAEGRLPRDKAIFHWFQRGDDGATSIDSREPDETGAFGDWPEDFSDVALEAQARYLDAASGVARRRRGG